MATILGKPYVRADGPEKVTGQGRYTADLALPGMLHARFLYAGRAHARILRLDLTRARALPGVFAVLCQDDVPDVRYGPFVKDRTLFARDVVRYEGEIVAAVAALTPEIADEALGLIEVEYEDLPPVLDVVAALEESSPLVHEAWETYDSGDCYVGHNDSGLSTAVKGDAAAAMAESDIVVRERYVADTSHPVPIEPHAIVAQWQGERLTVWTTSQVPFMARSGIAETLAMPESRVRVIVPHLGGGFGGKCDFHFEGHVAALARAARRPVRLLFTRRECFVVPDKARHAIVMDLETGMRADGTLHARRARLYLQSGAYAADSPVLTEIATMMAVGPYRIPHVDVAGHTVYTNTTVAGSTRAPTGPQICWAVEQHTDVLAARAGLDPLEFRRRNLVHEGDEGPTRQVFERIGLLECLENAARDIGWDRPRAEGEGVGLSCGWWFSMPSPSGAFVKLNGDGSGTIITGAQENGTGSVMGLALLAAQELGMQPEDFSLLYQDTDAGGWDAGSAGSQTTFNAGRAVIAAAGQVREQLLDLAAEELEVAPGDLELAEGAVRVRGTPSRSVAIAALAETAQGDKLLLGHGSGTPPPLPDHDVSGCVGRLAFAAFAAPAFFCHAARVRVDRETGVLRVLEVAAAHDFGRVINPLGATGQVEGGVVHGIGMATLEGTQYRDGLQANPHLLDYKLQTSADAPPIIVSYVEAPASDGGPFGIKGVGEPPVVPTAGAIANAVAEVTGVRVRELPMTPERVWSAVREGAS